LKHQGNNTSRDHITYNAALPPSASSLLSTVNMAQALDWWETCQRDDYNAEEWQRQVAQAAASMPPPPQNKDPLADFSTNKAFFRPFEQWSNGSTGQQGNEDALSRAETHATRTEFPQKTGSTWAKREFFEKLYPEAEPSKRDSTFSGDTHVNADDEETANELYHQSLRRRSTTKNATPKPSRLLYDSLDMKGNAIPGNGGRHEDLKAERNAKTARMRSGEGRRERKKMYRLTGAFQKVKGYVSDRVMKFSE
jgi:hypothetical protein